MGDMAGRELTVVTKVMLIINSLVMDPNAQFRVERADAAVRCAQLDVETSEEINNRSPTPYSALTLKSVQDLFRAIQQMRGHF